MHDNYNYNAAIKECDEVCTRQFISCNNLEATIGTNGIHGGDAGHGGVTCFKLKDLGSTCWGLQTKKDEYDCESVEIVLRGDCELQTFADALIWAGESLKRLECTKNPQ